MEHSLNKKEMPELLRDLSKEQRIWVSSRAALRVVPLLAGIQFDEPFSFWRGNNREHFIRVLLLSLKTSLDNEASQATGLRSEVSAVIRESQQHENVVQPALAILHTLHMFAQTSDYEITEHQIASLQHTLNAAYSAYTVYDSGNSKYSSVTDERYSTVVGARYSSSPISTYSELSGSPYSATPSKSMGGVSDFLLVKKVSTEIRQDVAQCRRIASQRLLPESLALWSWSGMPLIMEETLDRFFHWLEHQSGDLPEWVTWYETVWKGTHITALGNRKP